MGWFNFNLRRMPVSTCTVILVGWSAPSLSVKMICALYTFNTITQTMSAFEKVAINAAKTGQLEVLRQLVDEHKVSLTKKVSLVTAKEGNLEILKWLKDRGAPFHEEMINRASYKRRFETVKWLYNQGISHPHVAINFAYYGDLDMLEWLWDNKFPFTASVGAIASEQGQLQVLKWLKKKNIPLDDRVRRNAIFYKDTAILDWLADGVVLDMDPTFRGI